MNKFCRVHRMNRYKLRMIMLKYRILTAIILLLIIVAMIWFLTPLAFALCTMVFLIFGAWEWSGLTGLHSLNIRLIYTVFTLAVTLAAFFMPPAALFLIATGVWLWAAAAVISYQRGKSALGFEHRWVKGVAGLCVLVPCWAGVVVLKTASPLWLLTVFVLIWAVDTGAYFIGRFFGKNPLASRISPKKTREGFFGGIAAALVAMAILSFFFDFSAKQRVVFAVLSLIYALFAVVGDLFVSLLKRQIGIKDTGVWLPGHGGFLDRLDSTLSTIPVFSLGFLLLLTNG